jgi:hypothetical protein
MEIRDRGYVEIDNAALPALTFHGMFRSRTIIQDGALPSTLQLNLALIHRSDYLDEEASKHTLALVWSSH